MTANDSGILERKLSWQCGPTSSSSGASTAAFGACRRPLNCGVRHLRKQVLLARGCMWCFAPHQCSCAYTFNVA